MPKLMDDMVSRLKARGVAPSEAYAISKSQLAKHGDLKPGTDELTSQGTARQNMGRAGRAQRQAAAGSKGRKPSDFKFNAGTGRATLKNTRDYGKFRP